MVGPAEELELVVVVVVVVVVVEEEAVSAGENATHGVGRVGAMWAGVG